MAILRLDVGTVISLLVVGNLAALAAMLAYRSRLGPKAPDAFYILSKFLQALAWALIVARGRIPDLLSVYLANASLFLGFGLEALALCEADGRDTRWRLPFGAMIAVLILVFWAVAGSPGRRIGLASLATALIYGLLFLAMLARRPGRTGLHVFFALASLVYSAIMVLRAAWGFGGDSSLGILTPSLIQTLAFVPQHISLLVGGMGFMLLSKEHSDTVLRESEDKYRTLVEKASEAIVIAQDGLLRFANSRMAVLVGVRAEDLVGKHFADFIWPEDREAVLGHHLAREAGKVAPEAYDFRILAPDGSPLWISITATAILWQGRPASLGLLTDIDARKRQEEKIAGLLRDKELLLREVHHRVKNNLSVAMSLLALQSGEGRKRDPDEVLMDAHNRLHAMVELYERLYRVGDFEALSVRDYLPSLVKGITAVFPQGQAVAFDLDLEDLRLDAQRLSSIGIIVNEIVTNSMKYAFGKVAQPRIGISVRSRGGRVELACGDNGPGLPPGLDQGDTQGFGIQLISMLADQLHGSLKAGGGPGASWLLDFPLVPPGQHKEKP